VEICQTSTEVDFGPKLELYRRAGVREYVTVEVFRRRMLWRVLENQKYVYQNIPDGRIFRSSVFPGLWLDAIGFWADDGPKMELALKAGIAAEDHARFAASLAGKP
jgi:Uma2 family endonuclease